MAHVGVREWLAVGRAIAEGELIRHSAKSHFTQTFEQRFGDKIGSKHVLTVNGGTSALICALAAAGIGPGDEVLVPAYTWMATAAAPVAVGAVPILVDIDESLTLDPVDLEKKITPYSRAIIPVHMLNSPCDMDTIMSIARKHDLLVIEDACQAVGVRYKNQYCGAIGDAGAFSFNRYKNINIGEGGAFVTNDNKMFARARIYHDLGTSDRNHKECFNEPAFIGLNMRATEIEGAMLNVQLSKLDPMLEKWRKRRAIMAEILASSDEFTISPHHDPENAVSLTINFPCEQKAVDYAERHGVTRLCDTSKHVYTNWEAILCKRTFNSKMNPWHWAQREIEYHEDMCARTLDILKRSCRIGLCTKYPLFASRHKASRLLRQHPSP